MKEEVLCVVFVCMAPYEKQREKKFRTSPHDYQRKGMPIILQLVLVEKLLTVLEKYLLSNEVTLAAYGC